MGIYEQCKSDTNQNQISKVDVVLQSLSKADSEGLKKALLDPTISTRAIERVLENNNIICGLWAINNWRKKNNVKLKSTSAIEGKK
jgi:hypothetical protein